MLGELHAPLTVRSPPCLHSRSPSAPNTPRYSLYSQNVNLYLAPTADARDTWLPLMRTIAVEGRAVVLSANQCMRRKNLPPWITDPYAKPVKSATSPLGRRRPSVVTKTEDNHEINWPVLATNPAEHDHADDETRLRNGSFPLKHNIAAPNNHELVLPSISHHATEPTSTPQPEESVKHDSDNDFVCRGGSCIVGPMGQVLAGPLWEVEDWGYLTVEVDFEDCERGRLDLDVAGSYSRNDAFRLEVAGLDLDPPP